MEFKTILIIVLLGYLIFFYMNPDKAGDLTDTGVDKLKSFIPDIGINTEVEVGNETYENNITINTTNDG